MKAIVLAAGKGTRLNSEKENLPKVMRRANEVPLIEHCLNNISFIDKKDTTIVVGFMKEKVMEYLGNEYNYVVQDKQLGTGHAVACTEELLKHCEDDILIIYGDMPLIKKETFSALINKHKESNADQTILTAVVENILPYGRIIRDGSGKIVNIIEEKDTDENTRNIKELNVGVIVVKSSLLYEGLKELGNNNKAGEYYLTDLSKIFAAKGLKIESHSIFSEDEIRGVNTLEDLSFVEERLLKTK